ncbi:nucleotidyltransferase family protein [Ectothiorhodospira haloalkaliphila]|uniref:nucleotidyltransferase domain-containing protein n=1 Tax=Ectothiorhodospira haloalkaliphila TaxID=421628 RepID=UPI001EE84E7A|nr:nucleotidyltransferase family protein [Ectothiorhodospira haloalkaliphila]MCG5524323.1 nucleotidyltransferase family protein [Ectothiorhodospira haloalkaliphila]
MMGKEGASLLVRALKNPAFAGNMDLCQWDVLVRQARVSRLLGSLAFGLNDAGVLSRVPIEPRRHLQWAFRVSQAYHAELEWELSCIEKALGRLGTQVVLLKGAAYHVAGLRASAGRVFSDVDILVDRDCLGDVEAALMLRGWANSHHDPYDQRYYREWMHELPPMQHIERGTTLDLHHSILPPTARLKTSPQRLIEASMAVEGRYFRVLKPEDMFLHSATHLFFSEGEMTHGCRDLWDLYRMAEEFGHDDFWERLQSRAKELGLTEPLVLAIHFLDDLLEASLPENLVAWAKARFPRGLRGVLLRSCLRSGLIVRDSYEKALGETMREWFLIVRGHQEKMPAPLLMKHLSRKAWYGVFPKDPAARRR